MIRKLFLFLLLSQFSILCSCKRIQRVEKNNSVVQNKIIKHYDNLLHKSYYLRNRIPECKDRIHFMKSMISFEEPSRNILDGDKPRNAPRNIYVKIDIEKNHTRLLALHHFYFDLDCFEV